MVQKIFPMKLYFQGTFISPQPEIRDHMPGSRERSLPLRLNPLYHANHWPANFPGLPFFCPSCTLHFPGCQKGHGNVSWTFWGHVLCCRVYGFEHPQYSHQAKTKTGVSRSMCCNLLYHEPCRAHAIKIRPIHWHLHPFDTYASTKSFSFLPALNPLGSL